MTRENFTVLEDGQPQSITSFTVVRGGRTFNLLLPPPAPSATPEGLVLPAARPRTDDTAGRVLLIFIDDLHFEPEMTPHVRKLVQTIGDYLIHDGDLVSVVSSGPSFISIGPTYDKKAVMEAVGKVRGSGLIPSEIFKSMETSQGPADVRARAQMAFYTAYSILNDLEGVNNKRKAVLYISTGYDFDPFKEARASKDRIQGGRFSDPLRFTIDEEQPVLQHQPRHRGHRAAQVDARDDPLRESRQRLALHDRSARPARRGRCGHLPRSERVAHLHPEDHQLAALHGGGDRRLSRSSTPTTSPSEFKKIDAETSDYYVLGFYSSNPDPAKRTRLLEVTVDRPNVTVASRKEYSLKTPGKPPAPPPLKTKK